MTRTRARRLLRTAAALWAILALTFATTWFILGHPAAGGVALIVAIVAAATAWLIGRSGRQARKTYEQRICDRHTPSTNWRIESELDKFRAEISAWEAQQKAKP